MSNANRVEVVNVSICMIHVCHIQGQWGSKRQPSQAISLLPFNVTISFRLKEMDQVPELWKTKKQNRNEPVFCFWRPSQTRLFMQVHNLYRYTRAHFHLQQLLLLPVGLSALAAHVLVLVSRQVYSCVCHCMLLLLFSFLFSSDFINSISF